MQPSHTQSIISFVRSFKFNHDVAYCHTCDGVRLRRHFTDNPGHELGMTCPTCKSTDHWLSECPKAAEKINA